jgi:hypothetical protein
MLVDFVGRYHLTALNRPTSPKGKLRMALGDARIRAAKPGATILKLSDGNGLQLWITPARGKHW